MNITFTRPEGCSDRVFLVQARSNDPRFQGVVGFDVPAVPQWFFRQTTKGFHAAGYHDPESQFRGLIQDGYWEFFAQSNGVSVEENNTSVDELKRLILVKMLAPLLQ